MNVKFGLIQNYPGTSWQIIIDGLRELPTPGDWTQERVVAKAKRIAQNWHSPCQEILIEKW